MLSKCFASAVLTLCLCAVGALPCPLLTLHALQALLYLSCLQCPSARVSGQPSDSTDTALTAFDCVGYVKPWSSCVQWACTSAAAYLCMPSKGSVSPLLTYTMRLTANMFLLCAAALLYIMYISGDLILTSKGVDECMTCMHACHCVAGVEASVFDTQYDVQWVADGRLTGEPLRMPRTELFRKKPVVAKPMLKTWIAEVASCETIQVGCMLLANPPPTTPPLPLLATFFSALLPLHTFTPWLNMWVAEVLACNIARVSCMPVASPSRTLPPYQLSPPPLSCYLREPQQSCTVRCLFLFAIYGTGRRLTHK